MAVVATGFFDGVHLGHRLVLDALVSEARARHTESVVATFWPHPRTVLQNDARTLRLLTSLDEKVALLKARGADRVEVLDFSREFSRLDTRSYLSEVVRDRFGGTAVVLGYDNRMGHDLLSPQQTSLIAREIGLDSVGVPFVDACGVTISSTKIRECLSCGKVEDAAAMLGRPYALRGVVVGGKQLGRTLGFPTANMQLYDPLKLVPAKGAYLTEVDAPGGTFHGMTNVGDIIETHILDFDEQIYGLDISIRFLRRLRDEIRFDGLEALKAQLARDKEECRKLLSR